MTIKLRKFLLRYHPPGLVLVYENNGTQQQRTIDLLDFTATTNLDLLVHEIMVAEPIIPSSKQQLLKDLLARLVDKAQGQTASSFSLYRVLKAHVLPLTNCAFNKDGNNFITGSYDRSCKVPCFKKARATDQWFVLKWPNFKYWAQGSQINALRKFNVFPKLKKIEQYFIFFTEFNYIAKYLGVMYHRIIVLWNLSRSSGKRLLRIALVWNNRHVQMMECTVVEWSVTACVPLLMLLSSPSRQPEK